jgi:hypothetical protein
MIYGLFPGDEGISWESHLMGSVAGIFLALYFKKVPIYVGEKASPELYHHHRQQLSGKAGKKSQDWNHTHPDNIDFFYSYKKKNE